MTGFRPTDVGWIADTAEALQRLEEAALDVCGRVVEASNVTLLCRLDGGDVHAVYKPRRGAAPLWDYDARTLADRELAAFLVSEALGWGLVPPTVLRDGPAGEGSVQLFVPHDPARHYFALVTEEEWHDQLLRLAVFDIVTNNGDRKGSHVLLGPGGHLYAIDNGLTFHRDPKLRTVLWDLGGTPVPGEVCAAVAHLEACLRAGPLPSALAEHLDVVELEVLRRRARRVTEMGALPELPEDSYAYPWPPL